MLQTLRTRLLLSYVAILLILLVLIGFVLFVFLATRPIPTEDLTNNLTATLLDVRVLQAIRLDLRPGPQGIGQGDVNGVQINTLDLNALEQAVVGYLVDESTTRNVRTLVVNGNGVVSFDSNADFADGAQIKSISRNPLISMGRAKLNTVFKGHFKNPDGQQWLYVAQPIRPMINIRPETLYVMVAAPAPKHTIRQVFNAFGSTFMVPLAEAGLIGLVIALALSFLIAGSVARPIQRMIQATRRIAQGDYRQRVPVNGPREVKALAGSFNEMVERVAAAQQVQRDFLANVSHDLRTPLTSVQGFAQAIVDGVASDPASAQHAAQIIYDESARMHRMVENLLDLARIEAGQMDMRSHAVAPSELLRAVGESVSVRAREKGLALEVDVPPDLPRMAGDGDRLAQVFNNLLDNAIKHTSQGGQIALRAQTASRGISVTVQDTGEGIPPEDLSRIFERFYQVDKSRRRDRRSGMGLGLSIVRQIVQMHGGTIQVASQVGKGTIFTVWLPLPTPEMSTVSTRR